MAVFVVASDTPNQALDSALKVQFPKHYRFSSTVSFVTHGGTAAAVCEKLGVKKGGLTGVVVLPSVGSYYGVASTTLWDWLRTAYESADGG